PCPTLSRPAVLPALGASAPESVPGRVLARRAPAERTRAGPQAPPKGGCAFPVGSATMVRRGPPLCSATLRGHDLSSAVPTLRPRDRKRTRLNSSHVS